MANRRILILVASFSLLAGAAVAFLYMSRAFGGLRISGAPAMLTQIQKLNELVTVKYSVQKVIGMEEAKQPFGTEKLLLIVQARVLGGVDLNKLRKGDVFANGKAAYVVRLPAAEVLYVAIDERETKVWDRQITWWTPWVPFNKDLERQARIAASEEIKKSAVGMGILEDARRQAEAAIRNLLQAFGVTQIDFRTAT